MFISSFYYIGGMVYEIVNNKNFKNLLLTYPELIGLLLQDSNNCRNLIE